MTGYMGRSSKCLLIIVGLFLLLLVLFSFQKGYASPDTVDTTAIQESSVTRHVVLSAEMSLFEQLKQSNTIYEVRNSFDLEKKKVVIPEDCVLLMMGGIISNGILEGTETKIVYVAGQFNCQFSGSFKNENIHIEWFGIKSGKENAENNDRLLRSYVIPSMETIGNTLYMNPETEMYFNTPLIFNGAYNLDLRGKLRYNGQLKSIAVSIGNPLTRNNGKNYYVHSVKPTDGKRFYNNGTLIENVGVCLWNLKHCNISLDEVLNFAYCIRLCGNVGGCSSNKIDFTRVGGRCFYGIHCCSYDMGWVNENTFYGKAILNNSDNPANEDMCAIWFDARGKNTCNSNVFYDPCVEGCHYVVKYTNALFNVIHDARAESVAQAILSDTQSRNNTLYCKYWNRAGDYSSYGSNRVIKTSDIIPSYPLIFSKKIGTDNSLYYGVCLKDGAFNVSGDVNDGYVFGTIVEVADPRNDVNIEFVFEQPGRYAIVFLNDNYTIKRTVKLDRYLISSDYSTVSISGGIRAGTSARRASVRLSKDNKKMLIGTYSGSNFGNVVAMDIYSDNLIEEVLFTSGLDVFTLCKKADINAFFYAKAANHFLSEIGTIQLNNQLDLRKKVINLTNKKIVVGLGGGFVNGTINVSGSSILPSYNSLVDNTDIVVTGIPVAGTYYFQKGKPTWSNGSIWVDANGHKVE